MPTSANFRSLLRSISVLLSAVTLSLPLVGAPVPFEVEEERDIVYSSPGGEPLALDLFRPAADGPLRPAIVFIHGGGWQGGSGDHYHRLARGAAARGYVAVSISYRFTDVAPWPAQREDVTAAVRWLRARARKYGVDTHRIGAFGASAGGHLSLVLGTLPDGDVGDEARVQAVVNYFGPTDAALPIFPERTDGIIALLAGGSRSERPWAWRDLSPVEHVSPGDAPVLTLHGNRDEIVPVGQAQILHRVLERAGVPGRCVIVDGEGHGWGGEARKATDARGFEFLDAYLRGSELPLLVAEDFEDGAGRWQPTDGAAWEVRNRRGDRYYGLIERRSDYAPAVRSPLNIALLEGEKVTDFVLDVRLRSTVDDYDHRDLCLFFGHQDPTHFYYVHLGKRADPHAHSIFLVNGADRVSIVTERTAGIDWDDGWHRARVRRDVESGSIEVYFDDMERPVMTATDHTFLNGRVGIGSFDDTGDFDEVRLRGRRIDG